MKKNNELKMLLVRETLEERKKKGYLEVYGEVAD